MLVMHPTLRLVHAAFASLAMTSCTMDFDQFEPDGFLGAQGSVGVATGAGGEPALANASTSVTAGGQGGATGSMAIDRSTGDLLDGPSGTPDESDSPAAARPGRRSLAE